MGCLEELGSPFLNGIMEEKFFDFGEHEAESKITAEYVLDQIDDVIIFRHYVGNFQLGVKFKHPYRKDERPSFAIFFGTKLLKLMFKDFGTGDSGDCFKLVSKMFDISYYEAIQKVASDFGLISGIVTVTKRQMQEALQFKEDFKKKEYLIQVDIRAMNEVELEYWKQYGITKTDLKENQIYAINKLWINKKEFKLNPNALHFGYYFPTVDKWKIYSPNDPDKKWFGNVSVFEMEGVMDVYPQLGPLIITKSRKDRIILKKLYPNVCSCQNESESAIPKEMDEYFEPFPAKYCWFDSDEPGKRANKKLNYRGYKWINIPNEIYEKFGVKDPGDVLKHFGVLKGYLVLQDELEKKKIV